MAAITPSIHEALASTLNAHDGTMTESFERRGNRLVSAMQLLAANLFNPYRPERHYMRGPGPAWRKKHGNRPAA